MRVSEIMGKAYVIEEKTSLKEAAKIMSDKNIGSLIILKNEKIAGIITETDILKNISSLGKRVSEVMSKNVITVSKRETLENAAEIMAENKIKRLPVVEKGELMGIITTTDIIAHSDEIDDDFFFD